MREVYNLKGEMRHLLPSKQTIFWLVSCAAFAATAIWCYFIGGGKIENSSLALALCSASFAVGSLLGFIFTIFGDEIEPLGKIRDALIALASGLTGIGIAKTGEFGKLIAGVHVFANDLDKNASFSVLLVLTYFIAGFYFMYLMRKLVLNPALAEARSAMERVQTSSNVSIVAGRLTERLPQSLLLGREFIEDVEGLEADEAERLRRDLLQDDVKQFIDACEDDAKKGFSIQPDNVAMAARLHYYWVYFEKRGTDLRSAQEQKALDWIARALMRDPTNPDFQIKLADIFGMQNRDGEAASIIERLERDENSPQYIQQWLGYFLLFIEGREKDAIKHSLDFHQRFPDAAGGLFNASCGYAQLYTIELSEAGASELLGSENRLKSLEY